MCLPLKTASIYSTFIVTVSPALLRIFVRISEIKYFSFKNSYQVVYNVSDFLRWAFLLILNRRFHKVIWRVCPQILIILFIFCILMLEIKIYEMRREMSLQSEQRTVKWKGKCRLYQALLLIFCPVTKDYRFIKDELAQGYCYWSLTWIR